MHESRASERASSPQATESRAPRRGCLLDNKLLRQLCSQPTTGNPEGAPLLPISGEHEAEKRTTARGHQTSEKRRKEGGLQKTPRTIITIITRHVVRKRHAAV